MSQSLWTDAADAALREMWAQRLTAPQIADMLAQGARPGCTRCAVIGRVNRLGLHRSTAAELRLAAKKRLFAQTAQRARDAKRMARRAGCLRRASHLPAPTRSGPAMRRIVVCPWRRRADALCRDRV